MLGNIRILWGCRRSKASIASKFTLDNGRLPLFLWRPTGAVGARWGGGVKRRVRKQRRYSQSGWRWCNRSCLGCSPPSRWFWSDHLEQKRTIQHFLSKWREFSLVTPDALKSGLLFYTSAEQNSSLYVVILWRYEEVLLPWCIKKEVGLWKKTCFSIFLKIYLVKA